MDSPKKDLSIVIPAYNSEKTIATLVGLLGAQFDGQKIFEVIIVDDASSDRTSEICRALAKEHSFVKFISFFRNFGQTSALLAGLREVEGEVCVLMDDDLQNPPEEIPKLLEAIEQGNDFVFGVPAKVQQSPVRVLASKLTSWMATFLFDKPRGLYPSSFMAVRFSVVKEIVRYDGPYPYIAGLLMRITRRGINVTTRHEPRRAGRSQYNLRKLVRLWLIGFTNFSIVPLRVAAVLGLASSFAGLLVVAWLIVKSLFFGSFMPGWASTIGAIALFSGLQLVALGVVGEYVGRVFMLLNKTPQYSVREKLNCEPEPVTFSTHGSEGNARVNGLAAVTRIK